MTKLLSERDLTALRFTADALATRPTEYQRIFDVVKRRYDVGKKSAPHELVDALSALEEKFVEQKPTRRSDLRAIAKALAPDGGASPESAAELAGTALAWSLASERLPRDE